MFPPFSSSASSSRERRVCWPVRGNRGVPARFCHPSRLNWSSWSSSGSKLTAIEPSPQPKPSRQPPPQPPPRPTSTRNCGRITSRCSNRNKLSASEPPPARRNLCRPVPLLWPSQNKSWPPHRRLWRKRSDKFSNKPPQPLAAGLPSGEKRCWRVGVPMRAGWAA